jgi:hypothetical protein
MLRNGEESALADQSSRQYLWHRIYKVHTQLRPVGLSQYMAPDHPSGPLTDAACELCVCVNVPDGSAKSDIHICVCVNACTCNYVRTLYMQHVYS